MKTIIAVVLYNKQLDESKTLLQLLNIDYQNYDLVIVNNGPAEIKSNCDFMSLLKNKLANVDIGEYLENKPLSHIYNLILKNKSYDRFIFLDDDSTLDNQFLIKLDAHYKDNVDLQIPLIYEITDNNLYYPLIKAKPTFFEDGEIISARQDILSIGSGLVIYKNLVDKFTKLNLELFDNRYALYGVDFSLFRRMKSMSQREDFKIQIVSYIQHSLSRNTNEVNPLRYKERLIDSSISIRFYSRNLFTSILRIIKLSLKEIMAFRLKNVVVIFSSYFSGKHPRC
ncbi:glycosyltransferase family 2 protein [Klebsiella pneumoniae]|uniref:glycosyltransferase family 2 protein n=1 Tax=Klebsiella pneumoniae TaxID=573 RepID=UPI0039717009|nr:hypothetical protein [Klebsiella pneumoniae]